VIVVYEHYDFWSRRWPLRISLGFLVCHTVPTGLHTCSRCWPTILRRWLTDVRRSSCQH